MHAFTTTTTTTTSITTPAFFGVHIAHLARDEGRREGGSATRFSPLPPPSYCMHRMKREGREGRVVGMCMTGTARKERRKEGRSSMASARYIAQFRRRQTCVRGEGTSTVHHRKEGVRQASVEVLCVNLLPFSLSPLESESSGAGPKSKTQSPQEGGREGRARRKSHVIWPSVVVVR